MRLTQHINHGGWIVIISKMAKAIPGTSRMTWAWGVSFQSASATSENVSWGVPFQSARAKAKVSTPLKPWAWSSSPATTRDRSNAALIWIETPKKKHMTMLKSPGFGLRRCGNRFGILIKVLYSFMWIFDVTVCMCGGDASLLFKAVHEKPMTCINLSWPLICL